MKPQKTSLKLPILLMVAPIAGIVFAIFAYAIANFAFSSFDAAPAVTTDSSIAASSNESLFQNDGQSNPFRTITNVILFMIGAASIFLGPVAFVAGLVLLITRLNQRSASQNQTKQQ